MVSQARDGQLAPRVAAMTAYRVRIARLASGTRDEESVEAEAGALLEADMAHDIHVLAHNVGAWIEANSKGSS